MSKTLTQNRLKELLHYDPETGIFTWRVSRRGAKSGSVAGVHDNGYIRIKIDYELYLAHRLTFLYMEGYFPEYHVDHKNRIRDDNRWSNLRHVSRQCNQRNASIAKDNTSGITGVCWHKNNKKWISFGPQTCPQNPSNRRAGATGNSGQGVLKSSWLQEGPKMAQDGIEEPKIAPSWPQKAPKIAPRWDKLG